ncbi:hypothetical protein BU26DRAFT_290962 [Trematosphaeria pertusa]|uniref:Uncharacterized protein n=1 Tax=Trematosphaeria pertusa TaxID=390896 RepID=A0A6A6IIY7_9PLEO|nr:uncharacterized protein BU26DRAFT_290962 [Trematosphaeria pertusa]KAF2249842.1 hypothetical protein BU26DRAFT_290962 [Trematosphaeria pertusa]
MVLSQIATGMCRCPAEPLTTGQGVYCDLAAHGACPPAQKQRLTEQRFHTSRTADCCCAALIVTGIRGVLVPLRAAGGACCRRRRRRAPRPTLGGRRAKAPECSVSSRSLASDPFSRQFFPSYMGGEQVSMSKFLPCPQSVCFTQRAATTCVHSVNRALSRGAAMAGLERGMALSSRRKPALSTTDGGDPFRHTRATHATSHRKPWGALCNPSLAFGLV